MLPAVGYDNLLEDGTQYMGNWDHGNVLDFRLTDRTKLVVAPGEEGKGPDSICTKTRISNARSTR